MRWSFRDPAGHTGLPGRDQYVCGGLPHRAESRTKGPGMFVSFLAGLGVRSDGTGWKSGSWDLPVSPGGQFESFLLATLLSFHTAFHSQYYCQSWFRNNNRQHRELVLILPKRARDYFHGSDSFFPPEKVNFILSFKNIKAPSH